MRLKRVRASVLLYSLLIASIFTLLIQFYIHRVVASERQHQAHITQNQARLVAELTKEMVHEKSGQLMFNTGKSSYQLNENQLLVTVQINADEYQFRFSHHQRTKDNEKSDDDATDATNSISDTAIGRGDESEATEKSSDLEEQTRETIGVVYYQG